MRGQGYTLEIEGEEEDNCGFHTRGRNGLDLVVNLLRVMSLTWVADVATVMALVGVERFRSHRTASRVRSRISLRARIVS